jgi:hypothetical protein
MAEPTEERVVLQKWMLAQFRQRLRSAKVAERLDQWLRTPGIPANLRFEFVLDQVTINNLSDPSRRQSVADERI